MRALNLSALQPTMTEKQQPTILDLLPDGAMGSGSVRSGERDEGGSEGAVETTEAGLVSNGWEEEACNFPVGRRRGSASWQLRPRRGLNLSSDD
jgi:hypothetical protein